MLSTRIGMVLYLCVALMGCQQNARKVEQDAHAISGKVYLDDQLINYGTISFIAENSKPLKSPVYPDGTYNIRNPPPGVYRVVIVTGQAPRPAAGGSSKEPPPSFKTITIPNKYSTLKRLI